MAKVAPAEQSVPLLVELLKRKGAKSRVAGAAGLGELGAAAHAAIPILVANLKEAIATNKPYDLSVGSQTAVALGKIAPPSPGKHDDVIAVLVEALKARAASTRNPAAEALGNFGPSAAVAIPAA